jgi:hypothetical protein
MTLFADLPQERIVVSLSRTNIFARSPTEPARTQSAPTKKEFIMRKAIGFIFAFALIVNCAQAQKATWKLSRDVRATNNEISFNQGSNGVS